MARVFQDKTLLLASHNEHKAKELQALLAPRRITVVSANEANLPDIEEEGATFLENALLKAKAATAATNLPALGDDSGLVTAALHGGPGVRSSRWAQETGGYTQACQKLEEAVALEKEASASFECALALYWPDGHYETGTGKVEGTLVFPPRGKNGFGYDPVFCPLGYDRTFAEMSGEEKDRLSHRGKAMTELLRRCFP